VGAPTATVYITNIVNTVVVSANEFDPAPSNNSASVVAAVYLDTIGDGIPDWWRAEYFPNQPPGNSSGMMTNNMSCATCDARRPNGTLVASTTNQWCWISDGVTACVFMLSKSFARKGLSGDSFAK
jgi:hypothetical protein